MRVSILNITWLPGIVIMLGEVPGQARQQAKEALSAFTLLLLCGTEWLLMWLHSAPGPPRNNAIPVQVGEILSPLLQLSSSHAAGKVRSCIYFYMSTLYVHI